MSTQSLPEPPADWMPASVGSLTGSYTHPGVEFDDSEVESTCNKCGEPIITYQSNLDIFKTTTCLSCVEKEDRRLLLEQCKDHWDVIVPEGNIYRDTDFDHPRFPKAHWKKIKEGWSPGKSYIILGPTRSGKTRIMVQLIRLAVLKRVTANILWPEILDELANNQKDRSRWLKVWANFRVLGMDDTLLAGASSERIVKWIKDLVEMRMRTQGSMIITSQVAGSDFKDSAKKWGNVTNNDMMRVDAVLERLREVCEVIDLPDPDADPSEQVKKY